METFPFEWGVDTNYLEKASGLTGLGLISTRLPRFSPLPPRPTPSPLQMPVVSPGYHLCFWPTCCRLEVPTTPSLVEIFARVAQKTQKKTHYLLYHQFILKWYNSNCQMEEMLIAMYVGRAWSFLALSEYTTLPQSLHVHRSGSSPNLVLWGIYGGFIA